MPPATAGQSALVENELNPGPNPHLLELPLATGGQSATVNVSFHLVRTCMQCLLYVQPDPGTIRRVAAFPFPFSRLVVGGFPSSFCPPRSYTASAGFIGKNERQHNDVNVHDRSMRKHASTTTFHRFCININKSITIDVEYFTLICLALV